MVLSWYFHPVISWYFHANSRFSTLILVSLGLSDGFGEGSVGLRCWKWQRLKIRPRAVPREKGGTADNISRNEIGVAHTTKSTCLSIKSDINLVPRVRAWERG